MYFFTIVQALVDSGYTRGDDVRGAPYDWRKAPSKQPRNSCHERIITFGGSPSTLFLALIPDENKEYFLRLQHMIEEMAEKAGGPVVLVAHSMGNMYTLYFLNQQPQAWKDKYVKAFISLGPPWAGVAKTLRVLISGKRWDLTLVSICSTGML